jgi:hypothetical protein
VHVAHNVEVLARCFGGLDFGIKFVNDGAVGRKVGFEAIESATEWGTFPFAQSITPKDDGLTYFIVISAGWSVEKQQQVALFIHETLFADGFAEALADGLGEFPGFRDVVRFEHKKVFSFQF